MLPAIIPEFKKQYPGIELQVREAKSDELLQAILRDDISFYVSPREQGELRWGLNAELIYRERLVLVTDPAMIRADMLLDHGDAMSQNLAMAGEQEEAAKVLPCVNLSAMKDISFIYVKKGHAIRPENRCSTPTVWHRPEIMVELSSCISAVQLAASGLSVAHRASTEPWKCRGMGAFHCYDFSATPVYWNVSAVYKETMYLGRAGGI